MTRLWQHDRAARSGMTLIEILVAIIIFGVLGVMVFHFMFSTGRITKDQTSRLVREASARILMEKICKDLQSLPSPAVTGGVGLIGTNKDIDGIGADSVQFVKAAFADDNQVNLSEIFYGIDQIKVEGKSDYTVLKRRQDDKVDGRVGGREETLADDSVSKNQLVKLNLQYRSNGNIQDKSGWKDDWKAQDPLPKAIRVVVEIDDMTTNMNKPFQKVRLERIVTPKAALSF